jgi:hypothetical protein
MPKTGDACGDTALFYRVPIKSLLVFERSYNNNPWEYRNGTGAILKLS